MSYLLAAEADKIQDFVFRSSRLREVVGASQLLSRFCRSEDGVLALVEEYSGRIIVNDGGSFRVAFAGQDARQNAIRFGADLSELYRLSLGGSISVAEPVEFDGDFCAANKEAGRKLRRAKNHRQGAVAEAHMPYMAMCTSCGVTPADHFGQLSIEDGGNYRYLCAVCAAKAQERLEERSGYLREFLVKAIGSEDHFDQYVWPEDADTVGACDLRGKNYVAYLVADGNGIGMLFGQCTEAQIRTISDGLTNAVRSSMAAATRNLMARLERQYDHTQHEIVPVLPLILGGDDLFALIPAPYSLDFACRFCLAWEDQLRQLVESAGFQIGHAEGAISRPTLAAAVVICKSKYPYALAHRRAEKLLEEAKRHSKLLAAEPGEYLSSINFEVILGNQLTGQESLDDERRRALLGSLRPYWVSANGSGSEGAQMRGIELQQLLQQRLALNNVPNKRLMELRRHFENILGQALGRQPQERQQILETWTKGLEIPVKRSGKNIEPKLRSALEILGKPKDDGKGVHNWRLLHRSNADPLSHGMLDLLEVWDFAQDLNHGPDDYEPKEENE